MGVVVNLYLLIRLQFYSSTIHFDMLSINKWVLALALLLLQPSVSYAALRSYNFTINSGTRAPDGVSRTVYLINGQQPGPLIVADEGDDLEVFVQNNLTAETTIHWHGILQRGSPNMDGVPGVTQVPIAPGENFTYRFSLKNEYGFYWYPSHFRAYYDDAIRGPLIIRPSASRPRPFLHLARDDTEATALLQAERDSTPLLLTDWYHRLSDDIFAQYFETGAFPSCVDSLLANGQGRVQCLPESVLAAELGLGMDMGVGMSSPSAGSMASMEMPNMQKRQPATRDAMPGMVMGSTSGMPSPTGSEMPMATSSGSAAAMATAFNSRGCTPPMMFKPGYNLSSLPADTCSNTTSQLHIIKANASSGWLALDIVNAGSVTKLGVSLDSHSMNVYAADGLYVTPQEVKVLHVSIGQRYSVMIRLDQKPDDYILRFASFPQGDMQQIVEGQAVVSYGGSSNMIDPMNVPSDQDAAVWMLRNGSAKMDSPTLDERLLAPFESIAPPTGTSLLTRQFTVNQTDVVTWVVDGYPYREPQTPILFGNMSDGWDANTTLKFPLNSTIDLILRIANDSMDTMGHPMHLHGHKFWVLGTGSGTFPYNTTADAPSSMINIENPPYRDTVDLPPSGWAALRYVTDNPGAWLFHCHIQWHLVSGMALVLVEGEEQLGNLTGQTAISGGSLAHKATSGHFVLALLLTALLTVFTNV